MNKLAAISLLACSGFFCPGTGWAEDVEIKEGKPITAGQAFPSPNGDFLGTFTEDGFDIKSKTTGKLSKVRSLPPVFQVAWTLDSKTLVTVEHLAGGTDCVCFHLDEGNWQRLETTPPGGPYQRYRVTMWNVGETGVKITYRTLTRHGGTIAVHDITFDFDPKKAVVSNVITVKVSEEKIQ